MVNNFSKITKKVGYEVVPSAEIMDNGESRIRLSGEKGKNPFAYIRVELPKKGGIGAWQNAHSHQHLVETWLVERGYQVVAELLPSGMHYIVMRPGDTYTSKVGIAHNCFVTEGAITHTIKTSVDGSPFDSDWYAEQICDELTKSLDMEQFFAEHGIEL